jgi:hypothetical protein
MLEEGLKIEHLREFVKDLRNASGPDWYRALNWWRGKLSAQEPYPDPPGTEGAEAGPSGLPEGWEEARRETAGGRAPAAAPHGPRWTMPFRGAPREEGMSRGGGHSGAGEGEMHRWLKERLKVNPPALGKGWHLIGEEFEFPSGDRVDLLFEDEAGRPVAVEVEMEIPPGDLRSVWQAAKYRHPAAVWRGIACEKARGILAAPSIPENVKQKCWELGVEPVEVSS